MGRGCEGSLRVADRYLTPASRLGMWGQPCAEGPEYRLLATPLCSGYHTSNATTKGSPSLIPGAPSAPVLRSWLMRLKLSQIVGGDGRHPCPAQSLANSGAARHGDQAVDVSPPSDDEAKRTRRNLSAVICALGAGTWDSTLLHSL